MQHRPSCMYSTAQHCAAKYSTGPWPLKATVPQITNSVMHNSLQLGSLQLLGIGPRTSSLEDTTDYKEGQG